jgi:hypothetical protein
MLFLCLLLMVPHKLCAKVELVGDRLQIEAWYDNDLPADNTQVTLFRDKLIVSEGRTDDRGLCQFPIPAVGSYRVDVNAGGGHRTEALFEIAAEPVVAAGETKEQSQRRRWLGMTIGLCLIFVSTLLARRWFKPGPTATVPPALPPPPGSPG